MPPKYLSALMLAPSMTVFAVGQIYVSPAGNDAAPGTKVAPLASIARAVQLARATSDHAVVLLSGIYRLSQPILLHAEDSGLSLKAAPRADVTISGGRRVQHWRRVEGHVWFRALLPSDIAMPRQMYVDGVRANRTRGRLSVPLMQTASGYTSADETFAHWRNPSSLEMVYTGGNSVWGERTAGLGSWTQPRCPIAGIEGKTITMAEPCWTNSTARAMLPSRARSANLVGPASVGEEPTEIENAYELLGRPGEFYADPATREIFYTPRAGENLNNADVEIPALETLLSLDGLAEDPVHGVQVSGIRFSYGSWAAPSSGEGFSEIQANFRVIGKDGASKQALCDLVPNGTCPFASWTPEPGNVRARFADSIAFDHDRFEHLGAAGLSFTEGAHKNSVKGCVFQDISGNGMELAGVNEPMADDAHFAVSNRIEDNVFEDVGAEFRGGIPLVIGYARYTTIAHNQIDNIPYAAISVGWGGWMDKINRPGVANRSTGNVIEKNRIDRFMLLLSDGGGIYTQGRTGATLADGEVVAENVVTNQVSTGHMFYSDNGSAMMTIRDNVGFGTNFDNWGSAHKDYYDGGTGTMNNPLAITGNWWQQGEPASDNKQIKMAGNHLISDPSQAPASLLEAAGLEPEYRDLLHVSKTHAPEPPGYVTAFIAGVTAYVTWREPVFIGGRQVLKYIVRSDDGTQTSISSAEFAHVAFAKIPVQRPEGVHRFTVEAVNAAGSSGLSLPSREISPVTDRAVPGEMQKVAVYTDGQRASVHFGMPKDHGENLIAVDVAIDDLQHVHTFTGHEVVSLEGKHVTFDTLDGLPRGSHKFGVAAVNGFGRGVMVWVDGQASGEAKSN